MTGVTMLLPLLILLLHAAAAACPVGCQCLHPFKLDCSSQNLTVVPSDVHAETLVLNMTGNSISKLGNDTFTMGSLPYLKVLYLQHNNISRINPQAFIHLNSLVFVNLEGNKLQSVNRDLFVSNRKLEVLSLSYNPLKVPQKGPVFNIPSVLDLDISHCDLSALYAKTFLAMRRLEYLRVSHNALSTLNKTVFLPLTELKHLYLSHNNIRNLEAGLFSSLKHLLLLDLSHNKVKELNERVFSELVHLQVLYLSYNSIDRIFGEEFNSLENLKELYLQNNSVNIIEEDLFNSTINLTTLYLDNNDISNMSSMALSTLNSITNLYVSGNRFETFSLRLVCKLSSLRHVRVYGNLLVCDCELKMLLGWAREQGVTLWGSCVDPVSNGTVDNSSISGALEHLSCDPIECDSEVLLPMDSHLTLVYILSAICPLMLFALCFLCAVLVFTRYRRNAREHQKRQYNATSTGYLILDTLPRVQQCHEVVQYMKEVSAPIVVVEHNHVSPYSVSPVLHPGACGLASPVPPPVPLRPPPDLTLTALPHCYPEGNEARGRAFSTSEEEESKPLMRHYRAPATISKESSLRGRQPRRQRTRRRHHDMSASDTEPWSSYSEGSGSMSITECEVAGWSGSEASTRAASEGVTENAHA